MHFTLFGFFHCIGLKNVIFVDMQGLPVHLFYLLFTLCSGTLPLILLALSPVLHSSGYIKVLDHLYWFDLRLLV